MKKQESCKTLERIKLAICAVLFALILVFTYIFLVGTRALDRSSIPDALATIIFVFFSIILAPC